MLRLMKTIGHYPVRARKKRHFFFSGEPLYVPIDAKTGKSRYGGGLLEKDALDYPGDGKRYPSPKDLLFIKAEPKAMERAGIMLRALQKARMAGDKKRAKEIGRALQKMPWMWKNRFARWDEHAKEGWQYVHPADKERIGKELRKHASGNVLDVGAGSWNYFGKGGGKTDAPKVREVVAIDGSRENLARNPNEKRIWANLNEVGKKRLPFVNGSFGTVNMAFIMNYLPVSEKMLGEYSRVLKKGGRMLLCGSENLGLKMEERHPFNPEAYGGMLASLGFSVRIVDLRSVKEKDLFLVIATKK